MSYIDRNQTLLKYDPSIYLGCQTWIFSILWSIYSSSISESKAFKRASISDYWLLIYLLSGLKKRQSIHLCQSQVKLFMGSGALYIPVKAYTNLSKSNLHPLSFLSSFSSKQWCGGRSLTVTNWQSMRTFESRSTVVTKTWQTQGYYHRFYYSDIKLITAIPCRLIIGWLRNSILYCISSFAHVAHLTSQ